MDPIPDLAVGGKGVHPLERVVPPVSLKIQMGEALPLALKIQIVVLLWSLNWPMPWN